MNNLVPCQEHQVCSNSRGYGVVRRAGKTELLHRVVYCDAKDLCLNEIRGKVVRHSCDNSKCVEPSHLLIGTQADNVKDMIDRGRNSPPPRRSGDQHSMAKLNYETVKAIRKEYRSGTKQIDLARKFGVTAANISLIVQNKIWEESICEINARIAPLTITADGLAQLGFQPVGTERAAKLYNLADLPVMCEHMRRCLARAASMQEAA